VVLYTLNMFHNLLTRKAGIFTVSVDSNWRMKLVNRHFKSAQINRWVIRSDRKMSEKSEMGGPHGDRKQSEVREKCWVAHPELADYLININKSTRFPTEENRINTHFVCPDSYFLKSHIITYMLFKLPRFNKKKFDVCGLRKIEI
jgi:hypothetical protein